MTCAGERRPVPASNLVIRPARYAELDLLQGIERDAGGRFRDVGMSAIARDEPLSIRELEGFVALGRAWVAVDEERPIAYLLSGVVDGLAHIEQVSVALSHARRGVGASLIDHLARVAHGEQRSALSLTTFRDVPWNAPYYERLGFVILAPGAWGPEMAELVAREEGSVPGCDPRVAMIRPLS